MVEKSVEQYNRILLLDLRKAFNMVEIPKLQSGEGKLFLLQHILAIYESIGIHMED